MTLSRKDKTDAESENSLKSLLMGTPSFRTFIVVLLISMHPIGRSVLGGFGFKFPDERQIVIATEEARALRVDVNALQHDMKELSENSSSAKANNAIINAKLDRLDQTFQGFQIDFTRWKSKEPAPNSNSN